MSYDWLWSLTALIFVIIPIVVYLILRLFICPSVKRLDLAGKHVFITGGSKGIGRAIATECYRRGANVTLCARDAGALGVACDKLMAMPSRDGQLARYFPLDLTRPYEDVASVMVEAERVLGPIDVLINNAGAIPYQGAIETVPPRDFDRSFELNVSGAFKCTRAVAAGMKQRRRGRIVFVSSAAGQIGIWGYTAYSPSKFALRGLAEALQMEMHTYDVRVTVVYPPNTDTEGYAEELRTMPEQTRAISEVAGLWRPEDVAVAAVDDIVNGNAACTFGTDGWMLGVVCAGAAPEPSAWRALQQVCLAGVLRLIGLAYHVHFARTIRRMDTALDDAHKDRNE